MPKKVKRSYKPAKKEEKENVENLIDTPTKFSKPNKMCEGAISVKEVQVMLQRTSSEAEISGLDSTPATEEKGSRRLKMEVETTPSEVQEGLSEVKKRKPGRPAKAEKEKAIKAVAKLGRGRGRSKKATENKEDENVNETVLP